MTLENEAAPLDIVPTSVPVKEPSSIVRYTLGTADDEAPVVSSVRDTAMLDEKVPPSVT